MAQQRNYWIHRISHIAEISYPLLESHYLSYGFSDFAVIDNYIDNVRRSNGGWEYLERIMIEQWGGLSVNRYQLWRFLVEMKKGDWVLVPSWGIFSIYEIEDDLPLTIADINDLEIKDCYGRVIDRNSDGFLSNENGIIDLGFVRKVKLISKDINRYDYADSALTSRLKVRQTNVCVNDLEQSILTAYNNHIANKPLSFRNEIEAIVPEICKSICNNLNEVKFEKLVKWYFVKAGATYVEIPPKNPFGKSDAEDVDVVAYFDHLRIVYYVQVKHHIGNTDEWAVTQITLLRNQHNERTDDEYTRIYWVISSAENFSTDCIRKAKEDGIQLVDGKSFASMLIDAGFLGVNDALK